MGIDRKWESSPSGNRSKRESAQVGLPGPTFESAWPSSSERRYAAIQSAAQTKRNKSERVPREYPEYPPRAAKANAHTVSEYREYPWSTHSTPSMSGFRAVRPCDACAALRCDTVLRVLGVLVLRVLSAALRMPSETIVRKPPFCTQGVP